MFQRWADTDIRDVVLDERVAIESYVKILDTERLQIKKHRDYLIARLQTINADEEIKRRELVLLKREEDQQRKAKEEKKDTEETAKKKVESTRMELVDLTAGDEDRSNTGKSNRETDDGRFSVESKKRSYEEKHLET